MEQKLRCDISIGPNLQKLRNKYGISQEKLCAILQRNGCDIGRTTYAKYENGELNVKISVLLELKKYITVPSTHFLKVWKNQNKPGIIQPGSISF